MSKRFAHIISHLLGPEVLWPIVIVLLLTATGWSSLTHWPVTFGFISVELLLPLGLFYVLHTLGLITDWDMTNVKERRLFFTVLIILHGASVGLLYYWATPLAWQLRLAMWVAQTIGTVVTFSWKISAHLALLAALITSCVVLFGWPWLLLGVVAPLLMWSRVALHKHTVAQTIAGATLTPLVMILVLWLF
ncbi:MAG: hypothetical protein HYV33_02835 [Candidatus Kerfeldbacteria bacterium]|nr:hypothetical protein [Candidatus Kerfeldbacteria bacterium]